VIRDGADALGISDRGSAELLHYEGHTRQAIAGREPAADTAGSEPGVVVADERDR
jgi:hypothetical protein